MPPILTHQPLTQQEIAARAGLATSLHPEDLLATYETAAGRGMVECAAALRAELLRRLYREQVRWECEQGVPHEAEVIEAMGGATR